MRIKLFCRQSASIQSGLSPSQFSFFSILVLVIGTALSLFLAVTIKYDPDQAQMLTKGMALAFQGIWTPYGNAITGGGFIPGGLITGLVGIPLWIWDSALSPQVLIMLLHLFAAYLLNSALKGYFTPAQRFVFLCLFWLTPWRIGHTTLWNPSYLFFITAVHLYTATQLAKPLAYGRFFWLSFFHVLVTGLAFQLHASALILVLISSYLIVRKHILISWLGLASAALVILLSLLPYFFAMQMHRELIPIADPAKHGFYGYGLVKLYPIVKAMFYWPRYASTIIPSHFLTALDFGQHPLLTSMYYLLGVPSMVVSCWALCWFLRQVWNSRLGTSAYSLFTMKSVIDNYLVASILAVLISAALSPVNFANWYLLLICPCAYIVLVRFLSARCSFLSLKQRGMALFFVCIYLVSLNIAVPFFSHRYDLGHSMVLKYQEIKRAYLQL